MSGIDPQSLPREATLVQVPSGHTMAYREMGPHSGNGGPAVVFIHGSGLGASGHSNFKNNYPVFAAAGYRSIVPDLIGYGWSSKLTDVDYTLDLFTDTLLELLDAIGVTEATLVGNSLGGAVALNIALKRPEFVTRLVLMAPGGIESRETYFAMSGIQKMAAGSAVGVDRYNLMLLLRLLVHDPKHITAQLVDERYDVLKTQARDVFGRMRVPDLSPRLSEIKAPILGFWGIQDAFCPHTGYIKILEACPNSRFVMQAACGHWVMVEYAAQFNRAVLDFLAE
jgi:4,5:9,10-diseco-3-hydroxy-5,9,17-trioxoandrosta-1(10),2-diene-4-oate hydrolase